ncbi:MAG: hypothetical protein IPH05_04490 [Flavobacteriales bacterium]|jgi:hypothetical protein|nr:hypothetical protein [Flavobacteriales bacterium]MBK6882194.1 hypothetical protein [Flavobacteriales bacterium]MBK7101589.1 hypothetical protein [Flavobacteriales bacterium]MBK7112295.1 hypothetical protein [Flavobacteriales bacterium]MBK7481699.1 hypothetical protein [Flavobacteriales bacterium]
MATKRLGEKNIELLLGHYRSERKRLIFQLDRVRGTISELKEKLEKEKASVKVSGPKRPVGRPRKDPTADTADKPPVKKTGYRLSDWDEMVIATIRKGGLMPKEEIMKAARTWAAKKAPKMSAPEVEVKITRVLQKLSGKRGELGTHRTGLRRGYHYGLKEWFFASSGLLRRSYLDKLVIKK